jgi:hypothetical protein
MPSTKKQKFAHEVPSSPPDLTIYQGPRSNSCPFSLQPIGDINDLLILSLAAVNERRSFSCNDVYPLADSFQNMEVSSKESFMPAFPTASFPRSPSIPSFEPISISSAPQESSINKFKISFLLDDDEPSDETVSSKTSPRFDTLDSFSPRSDVPRMVQIPIGHTQVESFRL